MNVRASVIACAEIHLNLEGAPPPRRQFQRLAHLCERQHMGDQGGQVQPSRSRETHRLVPDVSVTERADELEFLDK
jgi:hypothetical protein